MKIEHLKLFLQIATAGSINKAAEQNFRSQQSLNIILNNLENELGVKLFYRKKTGVQLTPDGHEFLPYAAEIVHLFNDYQEVRNNASRQNISLIYFYTTSALSSIFVNLLEPFSDDKNFISIYEYNTETMLQMIRNNQEGIFLIPSFNRLPDDITSNKKFLHLGDVNSYCNICHKTNPLASRKKQLDYAQQTGIYYFQDTFPDSKNYPSITDMSLFKKQLKSNNYYGVIPSYFYPLEFSDDEWIMLEKGDLWYVVSYYLYINLDKNKYPKKFVEAIKEKIISFSQENLFK